jgi:SAM-dependent methyltransferase
MECLLCENKRVEIKEGINSQEFIRLWATLNVDVSGDVKTPIVYKYHCNVCELSFFDPKNAGGDEFYSSLGKWEWYYRHTGKTEYDITQKYISDGTKILDVGSGRGELYKRISHKVDYTGLELSSKAVALAQEAGINVIKENLFDHSKKHEGEYDVVCLFQVLEHLSEVTEFIKSIKRCLKPGGLFIVAVPNNGGYLQYAYNNILNLPPHHTIQWNEHSLRYLGERFNFGVKDVICEELQDVHLKAHHQILITHKIAKLLGMKQKSIRFGKRFSLISKLAQIFTNAPLLKIITHKFCLSKEAKGHSIVVLFENNY